MRRFLLMALALTLFVACGQRWFSARPRVLRLGGFDLAHRATLETLQAEGYLLAQHDPTRGWVVTKSKVDQGGRYDEAPRHPSRPGHTSERDKEERVSWIAFQAYRDGSLYVSAWGYHVRQEEGVLHRKLDTEIDQLTRSIHRRAKTIYYAENYPYGTPYPAAPPPRR